MFTSFGQIGTTPNAGSAGGSIPFTDTVLTYVVDGAANQTCQLPFSGSQRYVVDWDDGSTPESVDQRYNTNAPTHSYGNNGTYNITISAVNNGIEIPRFRSSAIKNLGSNNQAVKNAYTSIVIGSGFGKINPGYGGGIQTDSFRSAFSKMNGLTSVTFASSPSVTQTDVQYMFLRTGATKTVDLSKFDFANVNNYKGMFQSAGSVTVDISQWNFNGLTNNSLEMLYMFLNDAQSAHSETKIASADEYGKMLVAVSNYADNNSNIRNITMSMGDSKYTASPIIPGYAAKRNLIDNYGFTIVDGGRQI